MNAISIKLVGEPEARYFQGIEIEKEALYFDLKREIESVTSIPPEFQNIHIRGERMSVVERPLQSMRFGEELVVEHTELPRWIEYRNCVEDVKKRVEPIVDNALRAVQHHQILMNCAFFDTYLSFEKYRREHHPEVATLADGVIKLMAENVKNHFLIIHGQRGGSSNCTFKYAWHPRSKEMCGTRNGIIAHVQLHGDEQLTKYSVKCHHFGSTAIPSKDSFPDIIELFCYKILELLKVGPEVQFILPSKSTGSKTSTYIASKWRDDFLRLSDVSDDELSTKALIQLRLLNVLLFIGDLHGDNCGQWKWTENAAVVDLIPLPYSKYADVKKSLRSPARLAWDDGPRKRLAECPIDEFWSVVEQCLEEWQLVEKLGQANSLIVLENNQLKQLECQFHGIDDQSEYTATDELDNHIEAIRCNVENLLKQLNSTD